MGLCLALINPGDIRGDRLMSSRDKGYHNAPPNPAREFP